MQVHDAQAVNDYNLRLTSLQRENDHHTYNILYLLSNVSLQAL